MGIINLLRSLLNKVKAVFSTNENLNPGADSPADTAVVPGTEVPVSNGSGIGADLQTTHENHLVFSRLSNQRGTYYVTKKTSYQSNGTLKPQTVKLVFDFAYKMAFTDEGAHRRNRSGGSHKRRNAEIFANAFQGKIVECAACNLLFRLDQSICPDFSTHPLGEWDTVDLTVNGKEIAVKSTKHYGQLLLLETKDWNSNGQYVPNIGNGVSSYDYIILIRLKPSCEDILRKHRLLYLDSINRDELFQLVSGQAWSYNYTGYITNADLLQVVRERYILPQGALLNGSTQMDAENYYVQAGDLRNVSSLLTQMQA